MPAPHMRKASQPTSFFVFFFLLGIKRSLGKRMIDEIAVDQDARERCKIFLE
jgi:hypothetical protein